MRSIDSFKSKRIQRIVRYSLTAIVVSTLLMFSFGKADAQNSGKNQRKAVQKEISKMLHYPVDIMTTIPEKFKDDVEVKIALQIDDKGQITVDQVYSGSQLLCDYVKKELNDKNLEGNRLDNTGNYHMVIHFKTI